LGQLVFVPMPADADASLRTHAVLTAAGIPCTVVLDSAVAYIMDRVDLVVVGSEAVVESGVSRQHSARTICLLALNIRA